MGLIVRLLVNAIALYAVAHLVPGVEVSGVVGTLIAAIVLGIANAVLKPILVILALPAEILTLGLFTFVINALLFWGVGKVVPGFSVHGFAAALIGSIVLSIISFVLSMIFGTEDRKVRT